MVNIRELQHAELDNTNVQERVISYSSFEQYVRDLRQHYNTLVCSIPAGSVFHLIKVGDKHMRGYFFHPRTLQKIIHDANCI